jgi:hypothetical protein
MNLYAYCLSDEDTTAHAIESANGIAGAQVRLLLCSEIAAAVSEFDGEHLAVTRENVLAHDRVVRSVMAETTPLPFRFGTVIGEGELQSYLESHHAALKAQLRRVRGCVEMSVKVIWNAEAIRREATLGAAQDEADGGTGQLMKGTGTAFLASKRREILGEELLKERAGSVAEWLKECVGDSVREAQVNVQPSKSLVISAAHLVERARLEEYRAALRRARLERSDLHFLTSGAWPPYSFTNINS